MSATLHAETAGRPGAPRLALLHGFTQNARCWGPLAADLGADHELVLADAPGHGGSSEVRLGLPDAAAVAVEAVGPATWLGYSMGGRLALHVALGHPNAVEALVLVGATPGIADPDERATRRERDLALADRIEQIGVPAFLDEWLSLPLFADLPAEQAQRAERERNTAAGLASSLRLAGTGAQEPLWERLGEIRCPVLLVTGERDERFTQLARTMLARLGGPAEHAILPDTGHSAHLESPEVLAATLRAWEQN